MRQAYRQIDRQTVRLKDRQADIQIEGRQTERWKADIKIERQTDRLDSPRAGHNQILARQKQRYCLQITRANSFIILTVGAVAAEKGQTLQIETIIFGFNKIILTVPLVSLCSTCQREKV